MNRSPAALKERSLALHRAAADKLRSNPLLLDEAARTLQRWREATGPNIARDKWTAIVDDGLDSVLATMLDPSEYGATMRKASPFAVLLTDAERQLVLDYWRQRHSAP